MDNDNLIPTHGIIRQWVDLYGPKSEAPIEGHLGAAIALISAATGYKLPLKFGENTEPCTVNIVLEGESATARKTTTANTAREIARHAIDPSADDPGLIVKPVSHTSDRGLIELVAPKDDREASHWDRTVPPGNLLVWDEFGPMLGDGATNRKGSDWGGRTRGVILQLSNGFQPGLMTGQSARPASKCAVSILATVTRRELEERISLGLLEDGFMGRFALIPMVETGVEFAVPQAFDRGEMERRDAIIQWVRGLVNRREAWGNAFELLTPDGLAARQEWYSERKAEIRVGVDTMGEEEHRARSSAFNRLQTLAMKLAGIHAISQLDEPLTDALEINAASVEYGQRLVDMILAEIMDLALLSGPTTDQYALRVVRFLERQPEGSAGKEDLMRHVRMPGLDRRTRWGVIEGMHGELVDIVQVKTNGRPRFNVVVRKGDLPHLSAPLPHPPNGAVSPDLSAPLPHPLPHPPENESQSGVEAFRTFPPAHERALGSDSLEQNTHIDPLPHITHDDRETQGDTPRRKGAVSAESPPADPEPDVGI